MKNLMKLYKGHMMKQPEMTPKMPKMSMKGPKIKKVAKAFKAKKTKNYTYGG